MGEFEKANQREHEPIVPRALVPPPSSISHSFGHLRRYKLLIRCTGPLIGRRLKKKVCQIQPT